MDCAADPLDVYRALRASNPSPYMYLFRLPHPDGSSYAVVGSSPEALVRVTGERAITHPIAGSRPRGKTPEDDVRLAEELLADPKERSEHVMLVDLGRNDLQRVCRPGTVDVVEFMDVRRYSHVMHIESTVVGDTRPGRQRLRRAGRRPSRRAPSPAPQAPRPRPHRAYEPSRRGVYGGVVGYLDFHGDLDMAIAIRTAVITDGVAHVQAGAGIVADSVPGARVRGVRAQGDRGAARGRDRRGDADRHVRRLSAKGVVVLLALVGAGLLLVSAFRPWVTGAVDDAVLGATRISATGAEVAPGLSAVALAIGAAAIAIVAAGAHRAGRRRRRVRPVRRGRRRPRRAGAARPRGRARAGRGVAGRPHRLGRDRGRPDDLALGRPAGLRGGAARAGRRDRRHPPLGRPLAALRGGRGHHRRGGRAARRTRRERLGRAQRRA